MAIAYLCLGSNLGDRFQLINNAVNLINMSENTKIIRTSAIYETEPWGLKNQNWFLNIVVEIKTTFSPEQLLIRCQKIENLLGLDRTKKTHWGERPIDIDILFYEKEIIEKEFLTIPHPHLHKRAFVLVPLLEIIPNYIHPKLEKTISQLYDELEEVEDVYLFGTKINEL